MSEIMLGETKYFQAKQNDSTKALKIEEIQPDSNGVPQQKTGTVGDWTWITENVWGNTPVEIVRKNDSYGKRMGVYWEREKPVWDGTTNSGNLAAGLIRVIGRYWNKDSTYVIKLKASKGTNSTFLKILVVKPGKLLTEGQSPTYEKARNVFDKEISIDDSCIVTGGKYGIPPQIIKGQMQKESSFRNSFRYEPAVDLGVQNDKDKKKQYLSYKYFKVTSTSMGTIAMPTNHTNVKPVAYVTTQTKIKDYLYTNLGQYIAKFEKGEYIGKPYFLGAKYKELSIKIRYYYDYAKDTLYSKTPYQDSKDSLKAWLNRGEFEEGEKYCQSRDRKSVV